MTDDTISPLIDKYERALEQDPKSRSFAPLAECYRKMGMIDKALEVLKIGLSEHPSYLLGLLCLAECYFDKEEYRLSYGTLTPLIDSNKDNIRLMKLYGELCYILEDYHESLEVFKYLLFVNSKDKFSLNFEKKIKNKMEENEAENPFVKNNESTVSFNEEKIKTNEIYSDEDEDDDWIQVDLNPTTPKKETLIAATHEDEDQQEEAKSLYTHTLVDLYCKQGHIEKAKDILEKILSLNPDDTKTQQRISELDELLSFPEESKESYEEAEGSLEGDGREELMNLFDKKVSSISDAQVNDEEPEQNTDPLKNIEDTLMEFHSKLVERSKDFH